MICPDGFEVPGLDRTVSYEWNHRGTRHPEPIEWLATAFDRASATLHGNRVGVQYGSISLRVARSLEAADAREFVGIDETISAMQRRKDPDELEVIRASIRANLAA
jgi:hypothetical protein